MRQVEISRTLVFDDPRRARGFFEALVADNVGIGRPEQVAMVFARQVRKTTKDPFRSRIFGAGTEVKMDFAYKHSRVKQYLKEGRALRIETVINKPRDLDVRARLEHLPELVAKARQVNDRLLMIERAGQGCAIGSALFERIHQPYAREGQRTGALRFGDPRAMALAGALASWSTPSPASPTRAFAGSSPGCSARLHRQPDDLRPAPPPPPRPHRAGPSHQHLHPHPRRAPRRALLHEAPDRVLGPLAQPRQTTRPAGTPSRHRDHRPHHQRLRHQRAPRPARHKTCHNVKSWGP